MGWPGQMAAGVSLHWERVEDRHCEVDLLGGVEDRVDEAVDDTFVAVGYFLEAVEVG